MGVISECIIIFLTAAIHVIMFGHMNTFGFLVDVFETTFSIDFKNGTATGVNASTLTEVSSIGTVQLGLTVGLQFVTVGAFNSASLDFGSNVWAELFMFVGAVLWFGGVFGGSYAANYPQLIGIYGTFTGIGNALLHWTTLTLVMTLRATTKWKFITTSLVITAGAIGQIIFALVVVPSYTTEQAEWLDGSLCQQWRVAFRLVAIIGGGSILLFVVGIVAARRLDCDTTTTQIEPLPIKTSRDDNIEKSDNGLCYYVACAGCPKFKRTNAGLTCAYWLFVVAVVCNSFAVYTPYMQLVRYLIDKGLTQKETQFIIVWIAIGSVIGRLVPGIITCKSWIVPYIFIISQACILIIMSCWLIVIDYNSAVIFSIFFGIGSGISATATMNMTLAFGSGDFDTGWPLSRNIVQLLMIPVSLLGMTSGALGAGTLFGVIFSSAGGDVDHEKGYSTAIIFATCVQGLSLLFSIMVPVTLYCCKKRKD